jgi:hypothetical protein
VGAAVAPLGNSTKLPFADRFWGNNTNICWGEGLGSSCLGRRILGWFFAIFLPKNRQKLSAKCEVMSSKLTTWASSEQIIDTEPVQILKNKTGDGKTRLK